MEEFIPEIEYRHLCTEEEVLYEYWRVKDNPRLMEQFREKIIRENKFGICYLPGINKNKYDFYDESIGFPEPKDNISISRHFRYTTEFMHTHEPFEIVYVSQGVCVNRFESTSLELQAGDVCLITPGVVHSLGVFSHEGLVFNVQVKKSSFNETFFKILSNDNPLSEYFTRILYTKRASEYVLFRTGDDVAFRKLMNNMINESLHPDEYTHLCLENYLMLVFSHLLRHHQVNMHTAQDVLIDPKNDVTVIIRFIEQNFKDSSLKMISDRFGYTEPYISKIIKDATGRSYSDILTGIRLDRACTLLSSTEMTLSDISDYIGYENVSNFYRMFKKSRGITPGEYRENAVKKV